MVGMHAHAGGHHGDKEGGHHGGHGGGGQGGHPSPEEVLKHLDQDGSGGVSYDEFMLPPHVENTDAAKMEHFNKLDADGNGELSVTELEAGVAPPRPPKGGGRPQR